MASKVKASHSGLMSRLTKGGSAIVDFHPYRGRAVTGSAQNMTFEADMSCPCSTI